MPQSLPRFEFQQVLLATDLGPNGDRAFHHALDLARRGRKRRLRLLHVVTPSTGVDPRIDEPGVAPPGERAPLPLVGDTLAAWSRHRSEPGDGAVVDFEVVRCTLTGHDVVESVLAHLRQQPASIMVLATRGREGPPRWLKKPVAEPLARRAECMTLFVPAGGRGFVDAIDGRSSLRRVLLPLEPGHAKHALPALAGALESLWGQTPALRVLHVGPGLDASELPVVPGFEVEFRARRGEVVAAIAREASDVDLVVMPSQGHVTWIDGLRGSTTERVLRTLDCPLLEIPV